MLEFLTNIGATEIAARATKSVEKKQRNPEPTFMGIRVWKDGSIYPSVALVSKYNLDFVKATVTQEDVVKNGVIQNDDAGQPLKRKVLTYPGDTSNGIDIMNSADWTQKQNWGANPDLILAAISPKRAGKVDLFATCTTEEDGTPKLSVLEQGAATFGKESLLPLVSSVYNVVPNEEGFIDLQLIEAYPLHQVVPNNIFMFPKRVVRGEGKGKLEYVRRENVSLFPFVPVAASAVKSTEPVDTTLADVPMVDTTVSEEGAAIMSANEDMSSAN
jgi:hypothetical protein